MLGCHPIALCMPLGDWIAGSLPNWVGVLVTGAHAYRGQGVDTHVRPYVLTFHGHWYNDIHELGISRLAIHDNYWIHI